MEDDKNKDVEVETDEEEMEDDEFINSLLGKDDDKELSDEEKAQLEKNRNAELARKRREAEAKAKKEEEEKAKAEAEAKRKAEEEAKAKAEAEKKAKEEAEAKAKAEKEAKAKENEERSANTNKLGAQLQDFKGKYPNVNLRNLDEDENFKKFIDGKLLGTKSFIELYEDYVEVAANIKGVDADIIKKNYQKAKASSGDAGGGGKVTPDDIYSQDELERVAEKLPYMSRQKALEVEAKIERSIAYYEKN